MTDQTEADETIGIDVEATGENAVSKIKAMLAGYDIDDGDVSRVRVTVFENDEPEPPAADGGAAATTTESSGTSSSSGRIEESDRELKDVRPQTTYHAVLAAHAEVDAGDGPDKTTTSELADVMGIDRSKVSAANSVLYRRRMIERDDSERPYRYYISDHGRTEVESLPEVDREQVGNGWD